MSCRQNWRTKLFSLIFSLILLGANIQGCTQKTSINSDRAQLKLAQASFDNGNYDDAIKRLESELASREKASSIALCEYQYLLAKSYLYIDKPEKALLLSERATELARKRWGESPKVVPYIKLNIRILYKQKKFKESQARASELLSFQEKTLGKDSRELIDTLNLVIAAACAEDRCADTEPLLQRQLKLRQEYLGEKHEHVAASYGQLAEIEEKKGHFDKAERLYNKALEIRQEVAPQLVESTQKNLVRLKLKRLGESRAP